MTKQQIMHAYIRPLVAAMLVLTPVLSVSAQQHDSSRVGPPGRGGMPGRPMDNRRPVVDRLQERVNSMLRQRLPLTDDQFAKLQSLNARLESERRAIRAEEQDVRQALREELRPGGTPNESKVNELLERLPGLERRRINLQETEQKEMSKFLTPSQRARFFSLQDEIRRNLQELQRRRGGPPGEEMGPPPVRGPNRVGRRPPL